MPFSYMRGKIFRLGIIAVAMCAGVSFARPALADPHAMFYTAVGQRQLFFNVLAALDQADFVEPNDGRNSRQELTDRRTSSGFSAEDEPIVTSTKTDLSSILSRVITLEGNDLWTDYLARQFAIETRRRVNLDELLRIYCERGLGRPECEDDVDGKELVKAQKEAFVQDPLEFNAHPTIRGALSVLLSGTPKDQALRKKIINDDDNDEPKLPLAYDESIARWWKTIEKNKNAKKLAEAAVGKVIKGLLPAQVDNTFWQYINFSNPDSPHVEISAGDNPVEAVRRHYEATAGLMNLEPTLLASAQAAAERVRTQLEDTQVDGALPDFELHHDEGVAPQGNEEFAKDEYGEISVRVKTPAHAKVALTQEAIGNLANAEQNLQFARPELIQEAGRIQAVDRNAAGVLGASTAEQNAGAAVLGTTTNELNPQVAGEIDVPNQDPPYHGTLNKLDPTRQGDLVAVHHEQGAAHLLKAVGHDADRGGLQVQPNNLANSYGRNMIEAINRTVYAPAP